jgi:GGDEF domain-containing protein
VSHAERLRAAIARVSVETPRGKVSPTGSFGVAVAGKHFSFDAGDLIEAVDVALYQAKQCGRNRVEIAAPAPLAPAS